MIDPARPPRGRTDWTRLAALTDDDVEPRASDDPDAQPATDAELHRARRLYPAGTEPILLPVDRATLDWFKAHSGDTSFQEAINQVLKDYVAARQ